jgi:acyl carrier protein
MSPGDGNRHGRPGSADGNLRAMRRALVDLLRQCGVFTLLELGIEGEIIDGSGDLELSRLAMDSLAVMEVCIAIEDRWGHSIAPTELAVQGTVGQLARRLASPHN